MAVNSATSRVDGIGKSGSGVYNTRPGMHSSGITGKIFTDKPININTDVLDTDHRLLVITSFADAAAALVYYNKIKEDAAVKYPGYRPINILF